MYFRIIQRYVRQRLLMINTIFEYLICSKDQYLYEGFWIYLIRETQKWLRFFSILFPISSHTVFITTYHNRQRRYMLWVFVSYYPIYTTKTDLLTKLQVMKIMTILKSIINSKQNSFAFLFGFVMRKTLCRMKFE